MLKLFLFQAIQFIQTVLIRTIQFNVDIVSMSKTVLFQTIQFSKSTQFIFDHIDRTLSGPTTPDQCGPGSDGNDGVLGIRQGFSNTGTSALDCLVSYPGLTPLQRSSRCILQPTGQKYCYSLYIYTVAIILSNNNNFIQYKSFILHSQIIPSIAKWYP